MSLLADQLSKGNNARLETEVPPNLKNIVNASLKGTAGKKRIILFSLACVLLLMCGTLAAYYFRSLSTGSVINGDDIAASIEAARERHASRLMQLSAANEEKAGTASGSGDSLKTVLPSSPSASLPDVYSSVDHQNTAEGHTAGSTMMDLQTSEKTASVSITDDTMDTDALPVNLVDRDAPDQKQYIKEILADFYTVTPKINKDGQPSSHSDTSRRDAYLYKAHDQELSGNYTGALESYRHALETDSNSLSIINNMAYLYLRLGLLEESISYSQQALNINKEHVPALINMGIASAQAGNPSAAADYLEKAIHLDPSNETALLNLAVLHERAERFQQASRFYEKLLRLGNIAGYEGLARCYEMQGDFNEALELYRSIQSLDFIDKKAQTTARQRIRVIRNMVKN